MINKQHVVSESDIKRHEVSTLFSHVFSYKSCLSRCKLKLTSSILCKNLKLVESVTGGLSC